MTLAQPARRTQPVKLENYAPLVDLMADAIATDVGMVLDLAEAHHKRVVEVERYRQKALAKGK